MKSKTKKILATVAIFISIGASALECGKYNFNLDWKYRRAREGAIHPLQKAIAGIEKNGKAFYEPGYDDSDWQTVSAPHPVNAHDSFDEIITGPGEANFYNGYNFYRKNFIIDEEASGAKKYFVEFESVRQDIVLWVNGELVGHYEAGIAPAGFDISREVKSGENTIALATAGGAANFSARIDTREIKPGKTPLDKKAKGDKPGAGFQWNGTIFNPVQAGLAGNVNFYAKPSCYLTLPLYNNLKTTGIYIWADNFDYEKGAADIHVKAEIRNESGVEKNCRVEFAMRSAGRASPAAMREAKARRSSRWMKIARRGC